MKNELGRRTGAKEAGAENGRRGEADVAPPAIRSWTPQEEGRGESTGEPRRRGERSRGREGKPENEPGEEERDTKGAETEKPPETDKETEREPGRKAPATLDLRPDTNGPPGEGDASSATRNGGSGGERRREKSGQCFSISMCGVARKSVHDITQASAKEGTSYTIW